jgi:predicted Zn-dependent peptidase
MLRLSLLIAGAVLAGNQGGEEALSPDSILRLPEGPQLVLFSNPGASVTALRVSVLLDEEAHEAGAARLLQAHALQRVRSAASSVGAVVTATRTPWGIAYTVVGPQTHFEYMAWILRQAVSEPNLDRVQFLRARAEVEDEVERVAETPPGVLAERLWSQISPSESRLDGSHASLQQITPGSVRQLWARTHRPDRMTVVASGPVTVDPIIAALKDLVGSADAGPPQRADARAVPPPDRGRPQVLRRWYGEAFLAGDPTDPHAEVLALMAGRSLRQGSQGYEAGVELWELDRTRILAVTGAAYGRNASAMTARIRGLLEETRAAITPEAAAGAAAGIRFQLLADARTPDGLVNLVGRHMDATGTPTGALDYLRRLDQVTASSLETFLATVESSGPVSAELRP